MRSRITILCGFLLFSVMAAAPAHAGPWSAFVAWLSDLDPKSGGIGIEMTLFCPPAKDSAVKEPFECAPRDRTANIRHKLLIKSSAAVLLGTLNEDGGTIAVVPVLGIAEWEFNRVSVGAGLGAIHVAGTLVGGVTEPLLQARISVPIRKIGFAVRGELNLIPNGFPAGAFAVGSPATGTEVAFGLAFVYIK
jgi:hypothetical protein